MYKTAAGMEAVMDYKVKDRSAKVAKRADRKRFIQNARPVVEVQLTTLARIRREKAGVK